VEKQEICHFLEALLPTTMVQALHWQPEAPPVMMETGEILDYYLEHRYMEAQEHSL
jgi:hypothetical protein